MTISLGRISLSASSERPFPPCGGVCSCTRRGLPRTVVANGRIAWPATCSDTSETVTSRYFSRFTELSSASMVSVALSLGLHETFGTCPFVSVMSRRPLAAFAFIPTCAEIRCSDFPLRLTPERPSVLPSALKIAEKGLSVKHPGLLQSEQV